MSKIQVRIFNDYDNKVIDNMNDFLKGVEVVDIKMNTVVAVSAAFFTQYMVIYKEVNNDTKV